MNEKEEIIEMLELLRECGGILPMSVCMEENYPIGKTTVIEDVSYDSFEFVMRKAIKYIKEN